MKQTSPVFNFFAEKPMSNSSFLNFGFLAGQISQIIQLGSTHFTMLVDLDLVDGRRSKREDPFNANVTRHFSDSKSFSVCAARSLQNNPAELLYPFLIAFFYFIVNGNRVSGCEFRKFLLYC